MPFASLRNKNQVLAIVREIKIFVLNEPLAAQAHRLEEAAQGVSKNLLASFMVMKLSAGTWVCLKLQF